MEKRMKKILISLLLPVLCLAARAQEGVVSYALPMTTLHFEVEAELESFFAGPYARYASKYLGVEARQADESGYRIVSVKLTPCVEADPAARFSYTIPKGETTPAFLQLSAQGLVAVSDGSFGRQNIWRFPAPAGADFSGRGLSENITSEATTLYRNVREQSAYSRVPVQQNMVVEKSAEDKARETAEMIFNLRRTRVQIVTGDTDATFSGEAMASAVAEIDRLEKEYLSLFVGYSEFQTQTMHFDVVPDPNAASQMYIAFRVSETEGLVSADNVSGIPVIVDLTPQQLPATPAATKSKSVIRYRIPAICNVRLLEGTKVLLQTRVPVYQLGVNAAFPAN